MKRSLLRSGPMIATLAILGVGSPTLAQDIIEEEAAVAAVQNLFELDESNFDQWVFGNVNRSGSGKDYLGSFLTSSISELDRACKLTEEQKLKLKLAGAGDIKHFLDKVGEARKVFERLRHDQNNINTIFQETQPLATILRNGLFNSDSIFARSIETTLEPEQVAVYRQVVRDKRQFQHEANVKLTIARLDQSVGLTAEQRVKLTELVLRETKPSYKTAPQYETQVVLLKMARIPEARIKPILDEAGWKLMNRQLVQAKGMEAFLKSNNFLEEADPAETGAGPEDAPRQNPVQPPTIRVR